MSEQVEAMRRQRPVAVLTLLFGLLLGFAGGTGVQLQPESGNAQLSLGETLRRAATLRTARPDADQPDQDGATAFLPPAPQVVTELLAVRPAAAAAPFPSSVTPASRHDPYQARAPPAA